MQPSRSLLAFSVVAESFANSGDIVQGLMPLFEPLVRDFAGKRFEADKFVAEIKARYDFEIPLAVAEDWSKRLESAGYLENISSIKDIADYRYKILEDKPSNLSTNQVDKLIEEFKLFVLSNVAGISFDEKIDLTQEFYNRLIRIENLVRLHDTEEPQGKTSTPLEASTLSVTKKRRHDLSTDHENNISFHLDFLFASFIDSLSKRSDGSLQLLAQISGGAMLAEVVLSFQEPPQRGDQLTDVDFYLDAPIVMDLLGFDKTREKYAKEIYSTLKKTNANLWIFDHGIDEIDRAIHARISDHPNGWQRQISAGERLLLVGMKGRVASVLESLGIKIMRFQGDAYERSLIYFSKEQEDLLFSALNFHANETARSADARSLANIERLRRNRRIAIGTPLLRAGPVLVTRNAALASIARRFMNNLFTQSNGALSKSNVEADICILDGYLAGLLWITVGGSANQLPYAQLVANCATAISPKRGVITRAIKLLSSISQEQANVFEAIMQDERAEHYCMELTLGDVSLVTDNNINELYEKIRLSVGKDTEERLTFEFNKRLEEQNIEHAATLEKLQQDRDADSANVQSEMAKFRQELLDTQAMVLQQKIDTKKQQEKNSVLQAALDLEVAQKESMLVQSLRLANILGKTIPIVFGLTFALVFFFSQDLLASVEGNLKPMAKILLAIVAILSFFVAFWDNPEILFGRLRRKFVAKCYWLIVNLRGLKPFASTREIDWENLTIKPPINIAAIEMPKN